MIDLTVKTLDSRNHPFSLEDDITVRGFKEHIAESVAIPADSQRLIYCGRVLQDEKKLIEYDVNGKVIHLVQRAPPQPGQRGNTSGQGQSQRQGQGRNSHRSNIRHARAQVRIPRIDGSTMYLGTMSFPADAEAQSISNSQLLNRQSYYRLVLAEQMLTRVNRTMHLLEHPEESQSESNENISSTSSNDQPREQEQEQEQNQENDQEQEHDDGLYEMEFGNGGDNGLAQVASAAINAALSATGLGNIASHSDTRLNNATISTSFGSTFTRRGQSDGSSPRVIRTRIQRNNINSQESTTSTTPNNVDQSEQPQVSEQQQQTPLPPQGENAQQQQQQQQQSQPQQDPSTNANAPRRPPVPVAHPRQMGQLIGRTLCAHDRLRPHLERYRDILLADQELPTGGGPGSVEETQRVVDGVSEALHHLSHASHVLSDIIVDMSQQPPRELICRTPVVQHSAVLQAGIPIQVEAHISLHSRNQNVNNNNENGSTAASTDGAAPAAPTDSTAPAATGSEQNAEPTNDINDSNSPQQQSEATNQPQHQLPNFGNMFDLPPNTEVFMEVTPELSGNEQIQQNFINRNNNNNNNNSNQGGISAGIFPWGASPPPALMQNLMQIVAGQMVRGVTAVTNPNVAAPSTEQQATNNDGTTTTPSATGEGSNSNAGQSTQARGNTGTHPTTSTQTRSTPRPHVFHSNAHLNMGPSSSFDPFLPCNSHHVRRIPPTTSSSNTSSGQQQANQPSARNDENQTANSPHVTQPLRTSTPRREGDVSPENSIPQPQQATNLPIVNLLTQILSGAGAPTGQIQTGPGGWMQLFTEGVPVVQGLLTNNSNQVGSGMTLIDLLENTPGLGVPTNIGIIGPLRMDQTLQGEDLLFDLVVLVVQNITLEGWEALRMGHWEPLAGIRLPLRGFLQNFFESTSLSGSEERVVDRLISELQPTLNQLLVEDTNAREGVEMGVDIPATIESLLRRHFLNILRLLFDDDVDDNRFAQGLLASIKALQTEACSVLQYSFRGRQFRIENVAQRIVTRLTEGVEPSLRQWIVNSCVTHVCTYLNHMTQLPDNEVVPLLVLKSTSRPPPAPTPVVQQRVVQQSQIEPEPMETDAVEERVDVEPLEVEEGATFPGHEAVPSDWVPIIARDGVRQRRQLQMQMQTQGMAGSGVGSFSDAYLGGMPSKRRKLIEQQKPRILLSSTPNHSAISISIEHLVRDSIGRAGVEEVEGAATTVAADVGVRQAFGQAIRGCLHQHPRRQTAPDFPDPLRFPNATKLFAKPDETSKK